MCPLVLRGCLEISSHRTEKTELINAKSSSIADILCNIAAVLSVSRFERDEEGILLKSGAVPAAVVLYPQGGFAEYNHCFPSTREMGRLAKFRKARRPANNEKLSG